jgi:VWFA-related protein
MKCALMLLGSAALFAQEPRFDVRARLVLAPATVADASGRPVPGLEASDFVVFDNGRPQKILVDSIDTGVPRIALVVAVQSSGISAAVLEKTRRLGSMIQAAVTGERGCAGLLSFDDKVVWLQQCTNDGGAIGSAFRRLKAGPDKAGRMLDAVSAAVEHLGKEQNARRVLLLISESRDRGSETLLQDAVADAQSADVAIYAATYSAFNTALTSKVPVRVGLGRPRNQTPGQETASMRIPAPPNLNPGLPPQQDRVDFTAALEELVRKFGPNTSAILTGGTGGTTWSFAKAKGLEEAIEKPGGELHSQYVISFRPDPPEDGYHAIEVRVIRRGSFQVRARPGYRL